MALLLQLDYRSRPRVICDCFLQQLPCRTTLGDCLWKSRSSHRRCSTKKAVLKNFAIFEGKHLCFKADLYQKETPTKVFCCEYCEIFKNLFSEEHLQTAASGSLLELLRNLLNSVFSESWRDSFHANAPFQYPLNTSEKQMFSDVFRGYKNITLP